MLTSTGATATIERSLDRPKVARISPDDIETQQLFQRLSKHPEFVLSRREIFKYIVVEPGKRASEIQSLLKLERIEQLRSAFRTASTTFSRGVTAAQTGQETDRDALKRSLSLEDLSKTSVLNEVNKLRKLVGVDPLAELSPSVRVDFGVRENDKPKATTPSKKVALADLKSFRVLYAPEKLSSIQTTVTEFSQKLEELRADPSLVEDLEKQQFLELGLEYFDGTACPFCDTAWAEEELRELVKRKLARLTRGQELKIRLMELGSQITAHAQKLERPLTSLASTAKTLKLVEVDTLSSASTPLATLQKGLASIVDMLALEPAHLKLLCSLNADQQAAVKKLEETVNALPEETGRSEAKALLIEAQIRIQEVRAADRRLRQAQKLAEKAKLLLTTYDQTVETFLNRLYEEVGDRFTKYYCRINPDDESAFRAQMTQAAASVDLNVDFYGRGLFPPFAYHSEGHQDGMGLCLYLALMQQVLGDDFSFAVLDDVVMSVDSTHRKEVCGLLKEHFPRTQFIITTHDKVWLAQMRTAGVVSRKSALLFTRWTVDHGPFVSELKEAWERIEDDLDEDNVPAAAGMLRRYLESLAYELADRFGAEAPVRQDGAYELGELLPKVVKRWKDLLGKAISAAHSWGDEDTQTVLKQRKQAFSDAAQGSNVEQWAINPAIHYNEWANFSKQDFKPVVDAFQTLLACFRCPSCDAWLYPQPTRLDAKTIRCECGKTVVNLVPKQRN